MDVDLDDSSLGEEEPEFQDFPSMIASCDIVSILEDMAFDYDINPADDEDDTPYLGLSAEDWTDLGPDAEIRVKFNYADTKIWEEGKKEVEMIRNGLQKQSKGSVVTRRHIFNIFFWKI